MWAEVAPGWQRAVDVERGRPAGLRHRGHRRPARPVPLRPVRRLAGAVPPSGVTGAVFYRGRLFLAGQDAGALQLWSVDVTRRHGAAAGARAAGRRGRVRGPRRPRRARRGAALAAVAVRARAAKRPPTVRPQRALDLRRRRPTPACGCACAGTPWRRRSTRVTVTVTDRYSGRVHRVAGARVALGAAHALTGATARAADRAPVRRLGRRRARHGARRRACSPGAAWSTRLVMRAPRAPTRRERATVTHREAARPRGGANRMDLATMQRHIAGP
jgi:hypothetical protein